MGDDHLNNRGVMGQDTNCERGALPSAVQQIRKLLVAETPLANPLALTVLPSEQTTPSKNVSQTKTPVLDCEGKVKSRKRTSKKRKVENLSERDPKKERFSEDVPNSSKRRNSTEGQPRKKRRRKHEDNLRNENCKNSKKPTGEYISAGKGGEEVDNGEEMMLVTELGVVERQEL